MQPTGKTRLIISLFIPTLDLFTLSISLQLHPVGSSKLGHVLMLLFDVLICWLFPAKRYAFLSIFMCYAPIIYFLVITAPGYGAFSTVWILNDVQLLITMIVRSQSNADTYNLPCSITKIEFFILDVVAEKLVSNNYIYTAKPSQEKNKACTVDPRHYDTIGSVPTISSYKTPKYSFYLTKGDGVFFYECYIILEIFFSMGIPSQYHYANMNALQITCVQISRSSGIFFSGRKEPLHIKIKFLLQLQVPFLKA